MTEESTRPPKVFISYAWEDDVKTWVRVFAKRLRKDGVETVLDLWETDYGDHLPEFMEKAVRESDFVILICTPKYKKKSDGRQGGVGYEGHIITAEIFEKSNHRKFIPVLRKSGWGFASPSWAAGKLYIDLSGNPYDEENYRDLLRTLHGKKSSPPPVGKPPEFPDEDDEHPKKSKPKIHRKPLVSSDDVDRFVASLRKLIPLLRVVGVLVIVGALFWIGSWAVPKFIALVPTLQATATATQRPVVKATSTNSPVSYTKTSIPSLTLTLTALQPTKTPTRNSTPTASLTPSIFGNWTITWDDRCNGKFWNGEPLIINTDKTLEMLWQVSWQEDRYNYKSVLNLDGQWVRWSLGYTEFDGKWEGNKMSGSYIRGIGGTAGCWKALKK
jgi:hypothetical protein